MGVMLVGTPAAADRPGPARIIAIEAQGDDTLVVINRGERQGVAAGWRGRLVRPDGRSVPHGDFTVFRVTEATCAGKVHLSPTEIQQGDYRVDLEPPP
jgi:hypothetical protein